MFVRDHCDNCDGPADVGFADEPVRLSLRVWQCVRCGHVTVTAYDWQLGEIVGAEVMTERESIAARGWEKVRAAAAKVKKQQRERESRR